MRTRVCSPPCPAPPLPCHRYRHRCQFQIKCSRPASHGAPSRPLVGAGWEGVRRLSLMGRAAKLCRSSCKAHGALWGWGAARGATRKAEDQLWGWGVRGWGLRGWGLPGWGLRGWGLLSTHPRLNPRRSIIRVMPSKHRGSPKA